MTRIAGGSDISSRPEPSGAAVDRTLWTRVADVQGSLLDLLTARISRRHYAPHIHDEYAIGVTVAGLETMRYRGEKIYSGAGSVVVVEPGEAHTGGPALPGGFAYPCRTNCSRRPPSRRSPPTWNSPATSCCAPSVTPWACLRTRGSPSTG